MIPREKILSPVLPSSPVSVIGLALASVLLGPWVASAQQTPSGIAGVVKDTSGAVLPGVTVEAASPALIEKIRTVVTDGQASTRSST